MRKVPGGMKFREGNLGGIAKGFGTKCVSYPWEKVPKKWRKSDGEANIDSASIVRGKLSSKGKGLASVHSKKKALVGQCHPKTCPHFGGELTFPLKEDSMNP